jgi:Mg/Co/Ni transporter MgtE
VVCLEPIFCLLLGADPAFVSGVMVDFVALDEGVDFGFVSDGLDSAGFED